MKTYAAVYAIPELIIIAIGVAFIVWLIRQRGRALRKAAFDQAWTKCSINVYCMERRTLKSANV